MDASPGRFDAAPHPSPGRRAVTLGMLGFGLLAAPLAWLLAEFVLYAVASHVCPRQSGDLGLARPGSPWFWLALAAAFALAFAGALVARRNWRKTKDEREGSGHRLLEAGHGRSRFIAMCTLLASGGFLLGLVFLLIHLALAPLCGK